MYLLEQFTDIEWFLEEWCIGIQLIMIKRITGVT